MNITSATKTSHLHTHTLPVWPQKSPHINNSSTPTIGCFFVLQRCRQRRMGSAGDVRELGNLALNIPTPSGPASPPPPSSFSLQQSGLFVALMHISCTFANGGLILHANCLQGALDFALRGNSCPGSGPCEERARHSTQK